MYKVNENQTSEVFRGTFEECVAHLSRWFLKKNPKGSKGAMIARKPMADFCGVIADTAARWMSLKGMNSSKPLGDERIKIFCFLDMNGYRVVEFEAIPTRQRNFAELIGYGVITVEEARQILGYSTVSAIYRVVLGDGGMTHGRDDKMWNAYRAKKEELDKKKLEMRKYLLDIPRTELVQEDEVVPTDGGADAPKEKVLVESPPAPDSDPDKGRKASLLIMEGLLRLFDENGFDKLSDEELAQLGNADRKIILQLSGRFSALSSKLIGRDQ